MSEGAVAATGLLKSGWRKRLLQIATWLTVFLVARWAGPIVLVFSGAAVAVHWALKRWQPALAAQHRMILAVNAGYALGLCMGLAAPGGFTQIAGDIILITALLFWFWRRKSVAPLWILIAYHLVATGVMWSDLTAPTFRLPAGVFHTGFRAFAVVIMTAYLWDRHRSRRHFRPGTVEGGSDPSRL